MDSLSIEVYRIGYFSGVEMGKSVLEIVCIVSVLFFIMKTMR